MQSIILLRKLHIQNALIIRLKGQVTMDMETCLVQEDIGLCKAQCACLLLDIFCLGPAGHWEARSKYLVSSFRS